MAIHTTEEARARLTELRNDLVELRDGDRTDDYGSRAEMIWNEAKDLDHLIEQNELFDRRTQATGLAATMDIGGGAIERRTGGQMFVEADKFKEWEHRGFPELMNGERIVFTLDGGVSAFEQRAAITDFGTSGPLTSFAGYNPDTTGAGLLLPLAQPQLPTPRQARLYLRDLLPVTSTTMSVIPYVKELNPVSLENGATAVAEGITKPDASVSFTGAVANPTVIATKITLSKQIFADAPAVVSYLNGRLPYLVKIQEDAQILNGSGSWPSMTGILNSPGVQSQSATTGENAITLANAFAKVELADGAVTGVVMNPTDAWNMFAKRAAGGSGTFDAGTPFAALPMSVWGVPTYRTRVKAQGTALVGDFQRGAELFDRQQLNVQVYQERYAEQNLVLILVEERVGLAVYRGDFFVNTTFG